MPNADSSCTLSSANSQHCAHPEQVYSSYARSHLYYAAELLLLVILLLLVETTVRAGWAWVACGCILQAAERAKWAKWACAMVVPAGSAMNHPSWAHGLPTCPFL